MEEAGNSGDNDVKTEKKGRRKILQNFAGNTSTFFLPKAITGKTSRIQFFWAFVFAVVVTILLYNLASLLGKYFRYPVRMTTTVVENDVPFPHVTLCNMRTMDAYAQNIYQKEYSDGGNMSDFILGTRSTGDHSIDAILKYVARYKEAYEYFKKTGTPAGPMDELFSYATLTANTNLRELFGGVFLKNRFVVTSHFAGQKVAHSNDKYSQVDDTKYYTPYFYVYPDVDYLRCTRFVLQNNRFKKDGMESGWSAVVLTGSGMLDKSNADKNQTDDNVKTDTGRRRRSSDEQPAWKADPEEEEHVHGLKENQKFHSGSDGVRVVVDEPYAWMFPATEGFDVPPRSSVSFAVRARRITRLGWPYSDCSKTNPYSDEFLLSDREPYSLKSCQRMCVQRKVIEACRCYDASSLPAWYMPEHMRDQTLPCQHNKDYPDSCITNYDDACRDALLEQYRRIICAKDTAERVFNDKTLMELCGCQPPCTETIYDIAYSMAKWPAEGDRGSVVMDDIIDGGQLLQRFNDSDGERELYRMYFRPENRMNAMNDFARINVYMAANQMVQMTESADYPAESLTSDIGGQLGLWVGMGIVTVFEAVALAFNMCRYCCRRKRQPPS